MVKQRRNADGQFPKHFNHEKLELYEKMGLTDDETGELCKRWNALLYRELDTSYFLQEADFLFTKHELLLLFTLSHSQR